jgi:hypothetical protein
MAASVVGICTSHVVTGLPRLKPSHWLIDLKWLTPMCQVVAICAGGVCSIVGIMTGSSFVYCSYHG